MKRLLFLISIILLLAVVTAAAFKSRESDLIEYETVSGNTLAAIVVPAEENEGVNYDIQGFVNGEGIVLFLPCRADRSHVVFYEMNEAGERIKRVIANFDEGEVTAEGFLIKCMQSKLPSLEISLKAELSELEEDEEHETKAYGNMALSCTDTFSAENGCRNIFVSKDRETENPESIYMKGRGNMSWSWDKKGYLLRLESSEKLLGMAKGKKWVLLANTTDHSLLRNQTLLQLSKDCGCLYTADLQPVDLFVNGNYMGNYSLCSKVEIRKSRVAIDESRDYFYRLGIKSGNYRELSMNSLTGEDGAVELISGENEEEAFEIFERVMSELEDTSSSRLFEDIDTESWARYYWVQEIAKNTDATLRSVYLYWDGEKKKMFMISPWDLDRTAGCAEQYGKEELGFLMPTGWTVRRDNWYVPLFEHPEFLQEVERVYREGGIREAMLASSANAEKNLEYIQESANMNFTRWDHLNRPLEGYYNMIEYYMGDSSYESETTWLIEWLRQRAEWIEGEMQ